MAPTRPRAYPARRGLLFLLLLAVGFGLLAALLANPDTTPSSGSGGTGSSSGSSIPAAQIAGLLAVGVVFGYIGWQVYLRVRGGRIPLPLRAAVLGFAALLVAAAFVGVFHLLSGPLPTGVPTSGHSGKPTGGSLPNASGTGPNSTGGTPIGPPSVPGIPFLSWYALGLIALLAAVVVGVLLLYPRGERRADDAAEDDAAARRRAAELRAELDRTLSRWDSDPGADPRALIIALYTRLLLRLRPRHRTLEEMTPREIAAALVDLYPVPAGDAHELTALFEEARYSTHPLGRSEAERARSVLGRVQEALTGWERRREEAPLPASNKSSLG